MRSNMLNRKSAEAVLRLRATTGIDRELIGLCLVLLVVIGGHLLPTRNEAGSTTLPSSTLTMMQP